MKRSGLIDKICVSVSGIYAAAEARSVAYAVAEQLFGVSRSAVISDPGAEVPDVDADLLERVCMRLAGHEPLQYVLGSAEFCGFKFNVGPGVLVPRPETEELVAWIVADHRPTANRLNVLDVGTGSGAIAVTLALELPGCRVAATDVSDDALSVARTNSERLGARVDFLRNDILNDAPDTLIAGGTFDIIVSNPPYIPRSEYAAMRDNVRKYEPPGALFVEDSDPLLFYRTIAERGRVMLNAGGFIYFESHENFAEGVCAMLHDLGYCEVEMRRDINDKPRMIRCRKK